MRSEPGASLGRRAPGHLLGALFASGLLAAMLTACGISLHADEDDTEIFKQLTVTGDFRAGGSLSLVLLYEQPYPVGVDVECVLLAVDPKETATPEVTTTPTNTPPARVEPPVAIVTVRARPTPKHKVLDILQRTLSAVGTPQTWSPTAALAVRGTIKDGFSAPERPGAYAVKCFTPDDDNNAISQRITIAPRAPATPTP